MEKTFDPDTALELRYAHLAPEVWDELGKIERTGWVMRGVKNPETVQEHTLGVRKLALSMFKELPEFTDADRQDLLNILEIHDWAEAIHGDEAIVTEDMEERKTKKAKKFENELAAMTKICDAIGGGGWQGDYATLDALLDDE